MKPIINLVVEDFRDENQRENRKLRERDEKTRLSKKQTKIEYSRTKCEYTYKRIDKSEKQMVQNKRKRNKNDILLSEMQYDGMGSEEGTSYSSVSLHWKKQVLNFVYDCQVYNNECLNNALSLKNGTGDTRKYIAVRLSIVIVSDGGMEHGSGRQTSSTGTTSGFLFTMHNDF
ncbi:hypothetical protein C0J52_22539 [Blattella germanica]|nr:hypothetical protein C0J52_22539 [Blattella germanica]